MHTGVQILEEVLPHDVLKNLETLAGVNESDITIGDNGIKFVFERSLKANFCRVVRYHDNVIVEFRKKTDNLLEGKMDQLVYENVIKAQEFSDVFESVTGIYLSYLK